MIFRNKAPGSRISTVIPIITHHPVIVHFGVYELLTTVNQYLTIFDNTFVTFIGTNQSSIQGKVLLLLAE